MNVTINSERLTAAEYIDGQGIGRRLIKKAHEIAGGESEIVMYTCVNENAIPFYEKIGMTKAHDIMEYNRMPWTSFTVE